MHKAEQVGERRNERGRRAAQPVAGKEIERHAGPDVQQKEQDLGRLERVAPGEGRR